MHVILMSEGQGRTVSFGLGARHIALFAGVLAVAVLAAAFLGFQYAAGGAPVQTILVPASASGRQVDQLATRVGELQARLARLTAIGERVAGKTGVPLPEAGGRDPGRGGPLLAPERPTTTADLAALLDRLTEQMDLASDHLLVLDAELLLRQASQGKLPMDRPVAESSYVSSVFGTRIDPFTGQRARHDGLDFADNLGAPILAAESGVVLTATSHPQFGNEVEIDHGNGLVTRYGHTSRLLVKKGDLVKRGQKIAEMGSTGRSTGPHLHFEVLRNGVPQNPIGYLSGRS
ncbi:M23 family metallopeptidase [Parasulfuritortus cantonensis]|uniref:M23 family metallopeptidase n=1 Tax=Parasulfuritortus cantonensis TaxID=2528202 RepID=A0A4R1B7N5_9PROT|nr:M23 family metallopeptidase [Parasulfuritortus cantonensis]TCJ11873.1 M23 family metallopeptidase [Parasulfuritortus cantonensis]